MKRIAAPHSHAGPDNVLPLINVVLLLVLAFLMAGNFSVPLPEGFDPLQSSVEEAAATAAETRIATVAADGTVDFEGAGGDALSAAFAAIAEEGGTLEVRADTRAPARAVIALLVAAEEAGLDNVAVVTVGRRP